MYSKTVKEFLTGPEKTGLIYTKYSYLYIHIMVPIFYYVAMCYTKSVNFIEFLMEQV